MGSKPFEYIEMPLESAPGVPIMLDQDGKPMKTRGRVRIVDDEGNVVLDTGWIEGELDNSGVESVVVVRLPGEDGEYMKCPETDDGE